jgi:hypothetical protein
MTYIQEEWKPVVGWEDAYEVSSFGRVRRIGAGRGVTHGAVMKPQTVRDGYQAIVLRTPGIRQGKFIHRLVAESFIHAIPAGMHVNHMDGNPSNNLLSNLEIVTQSENILHALRVLWPERDYLAKKLDRDKVSQIRAMAATQSNRMIAAIFNVSEATIHNIISRKTWHHIA